MPKIYTEENLKKVWVAIHELDKRRSEVAEALDISTDEVDNMYEAARKRFSYGAARHQYVKKKFRLPTLADELPPKFERPKAVYSNRTPMGIASPGLFDE